MGILITGSSGYLGGRLTEYLSKKHNLTLLSRNKNQINWTDKEHSLRQYKIDWQNIESSSGLFQDTKTVIHLAGLNAQESLQDPARAIEVNKNNTEKILSLSLKNNIDNFIYLSTAHVYSNPLQGTITEESPTIGDHPYATSHLMGENVLLESHQKGLMNIKIVRLSNAYGPPIDKNTNCWMLIMNDLCMQLATKKRMKIKSNGNQRRNFIAISDTLQAIEHLMNLPYQEKPIFNVGSLWNPQIKEVVDYLADRFEIITNIRPDTEFNDLSNESSLNLDYRIDKLLESGFSFDKKDSKEKEIDSLINKCLEFYN
tara:strand:+ start:2591 stop:3532 length:942 start_codon:yes stop_codon:yes gene_type:complete